MSLRSRHRGQRRPVLEIWYTGNGSDTFDPRITTSQSVLINWQTSDGQNTTTSGTTHDFSYTPASGGPYRCTARVAGGLGLVTAIDYRTDDVAAFSDPRKLSWCTTYAPRGNSLPVILSHLPPSATTLDATLCTNVVGAPSDIPRSYQLSVAVSISNISGDASGFPRCSSLYAYSCPYLYGSLLDIGTGATVNLSLFSSTGITPGSIAHLTAIRDIRIYSMGWSAAQNTTVLLSAWNARASYTYARNIALRISAPTGTPGTEPPAEGVSNDDWSWNAGTSRHDPLTGYAVISDLQTDFYSEGFNPWLVTIV